MGVKAVEISTALKRRMYAKISYLYYYEYYNKNPSDLSYGIPTYPIWEDDT